MRIVPTELIPTDAILADTLYTLDGRVLLKAGAKLSANMIEKKSMLTVFLQYIFTMNIAISRLIGW